MESKPFGKGSNQLRKARYSKENQVYFVTTTTYNRQAIFTEFHLASKAIQGFTHPKTLKDNQLLCWVLMPDHAHWLIQLGQKTTLSRLISNMKAATTRQLRKQGFNQAVWQPSFYDHALRKEESLIQVARYIVANPLRAGLVSSVGQYPYWDAIYL